MGNDAISEDFIFVMSKTEPKTTAKKAAWPAKGFEEIAYEPTEDDEKEWVLKEIKEQIISTVSNIKTKQLRDTEKAYIVLGVTAKFIPNENNPSKVRKQVFDKAMLNVLIRLSADVLAYLNVEHTKLLVSCPIWKLTEIVDKEKYAKRYFEGVKRISPLLFGEQVSKFLRQDSEWVNVLKDIVIQLIPNLPTDKRKEYAKTVIQYLEKIGEDTPAIDPKDYDIDYDFDFIIAHLRKKQIEELLQASNFVFKVSEIPRGLAENISLTSKRRHVKSQSIRGKASSTGLQNVRIDELPIVCLLDSGVNDIPQLNGLLVIKDGYHFHDLSDDYRKHGHGTPIACLAIFGEELSGPKARVISYKIYSDKDRRLYPEGYRRAIVKYSNPHASNRTRIFLSSIAFERYNDEITAWIDRLIQENNICAVFAAGNIDPKIVSDYAFKGIPSSSYVCNHPILDPAQAVNAVAVGAIAKKEAPNSISRRNELSPFTTCGTTNSCLYQCPKPEFVQNGGNCCKDGTELGVESFDKYGTKVHDLLGTSFSVPILISNLVEIYAKYGRKFGNAETLKALALASSNGSLQKCMGYGETKSFNKCDSLHALVCSEGRIPLPDTTDERYRTDYSAKISIAIPKFVNSIKMFLVHSDNHYRTPMPYLNTYLKVRAKKTARDTGYVTLSNPNEVEKKSHMKVFKWAFETQSMEGTWDFYITPEITADMLAEHKKATTIRYGCAFLVNSKSPTRPISLTKEMYDINKQIGAVA